MIKPSNIYFYYRIDDPDKEPIGRVNAQSLDVAKIKASRIKRLSKKDFLELYNIEQENQMKDESN